MKYLRWLVADIRKNVLTQNFLWGLAIFMAIELFVLGVYYNQRAMRDAASHSPCDQ